MNITVATLIYKSPRYLDFVIDSLKRHESKIHNVTYLVVMNDADEVVLDHVKSKEWPNVKFVDHRNENPKDYWIQNVYRAWSRCLQECETPYICFVNSDMAFTDGWLDALAQHDLTKHIPTSRLVECGRMPSLPGLISKNFGQTLDEVIAQQGEFEKFAKVLAENKFTPNVGAYMPSLFSKEILDSVGGWSLNYVNHWGQIPGDKITFGRLAAKGLTHIMCHDSIVLHWQRGESADCGDLK